MVNCHSPSFFSAVVLCYYSVRKVWNQSGPCWNQDQFLTSPFKFVSLVISQVAWNECEQSQCLACITKTPAHMLNESFHKLLFCSNMGKFTVIKIDTGISHWITHVANLATSIHTHQLPLSPTPIYTCINWYKIIFKSYIPPPDFVSGCVVIILIC